MSETGALVQSGPSALPIGGPSDLSSRAQAPFSSLLRLCLLCRSPSPCCLLPRTAVHPSVLCLSLCLSRSCPSAPCLFLLGDSRDDTRPPNRRTASLMVWTMILFLRPFPLVGRVSVRSTICEGERLCRPPPPRPRGVWLCSNPDGWPHPRPSVVQPGQRPAPTNGLASEGPGSFKASPAPCCPSIWGRGEAEAAAGNRCAAWASAPATRLLRTPLRPPHRLPASPLPAPPGGGKPSSALASSEASAVPSCSTRSRGGDGWTGFSTANLNSFCGSCVLFSSSGGFDSWSVSSCSSLLSAAPLLHVVGPLLPGCSQGPASAFSWAPPRNPWCCLSLPLPSSRRSGPPKVVSLRLALCHQCHPGQPLGYLDPLVQMALPRVRQKKPWA